MCSFCHFSDLSERSTNDQAAAVGREGTGKSSYLNPVSTQEERFLNCWFFVRDGNSHHRFI